jgi:hypothetical protein
MNVTDAKTAPAVLISALEHIPRLVKSSLTKVIEVQLLFYDVKHLAQRCS